MGSGVKHFYIYYSIKERTENTTDATIEVVNAESVRLTAVLAALIEEQATPAATTTASKRKGMKYLFDIFLSSLAQL